MNTRFLLLFLSPVLLIAILLLFLEDSEADECRICKIRKSQLCQEECALVDSRLVENCENDCTIEYCTHKCDKSERESDVVIPKSESSNVPVVPSEPSYEAIK